MTAETTILKQIQIAASKLGYRLFRNNVSLAWASSRIRHIRKTEKITITLNRGDIIMFNARPIHAGLCEGSSDLCGWKSITITPDMVGKTVAVFAACEVKTKRGVTSEKQRDFISAVNNAGGCAFIARDVSDIK